MSAFDTVRLADARERLAVEPGAVLQILARAYAKQIFVDGLFHADPHPGNLFVIDEPDARTRPRVLFVDFGLSERLDPTLRRELRKGIHALLQRDLESFVDRMDSMGMIAPGARPGVTQAVGEMFERIQQAGGGTLGVAGSQVLGLKDEAKALLQKTPGLQLPNDLLLYAKTLSYLFALGEDLDPDVDLIKLSLPYLLRFLAEKD
jgi:ubiquinone biosynthesis protein